MIETEKYTEELEFEKCCHVVTRLEEIGNELKDLETYIHDGRTEPSYSTYDRLVAKHFGKLDDRIKITQNVVRVYAGTIAIDLRLRSIK